MNKIFTFSSLVLSGILLGSIAGRYANMDSIKLKRSNLSKNAKSVKNFMKKSEDEMNQYFI